MASELRAVTADELGGWVEFLAPAFALMAEKSHGRWLAEDVIAHIAERKMQLWLAVDQGAVKAVLLTEIWVYPRRKALRAVAGVGRGWKEWSHLRHGIMEWGRQNGCDLFEVIAPRKWRHMFPEFREYHVMLEYDDA